MRASSCTRRLLSPPRSPAAPGWPGDSDERDQKAKGPRTLVATQCLTHKDLLSPVAERSSRSEGLDGRQGVAASSFFNVLLLL